MSLEQLKQELEEKLAKLNGSTDQHEKMQIAINLKVAFATVKRYMNGEVRKLDVAEQIINEAEKILAAKQTA